MSGPVSQTENITSGKTSTTKAITVGVDFLRKLFKDAEHDIEIRCLPLAEPFFSTNLTEIENFINKNIHKRNIYFGCCTRAEKVGTKEGCREVVALWLDLDFKDLTGGEGEAKKIIETMIPPSVIVHTGNGFHVYWLLREPIEALPEIIETYLKGLARHYNGDSSAAELARILRVPGTFNYKQGGKKPVSIIRADYNLRYNLSDFDDLKISSTNTKEKTSRNDTADVIPEGQRNSTLTSLAGTMRRRGMTDIEIAAALHAINKNRCRPSLPDAEVDSIVKSVGRYEGTTTNTSGNQNLTERFGQPYYTNKDDIVTDINESFWAGIYHVENTGLFEPDEKTFYHYNPESGLYESISQDSIKQRISRRLLEVARTENLSLERKRTDVTLKAIISQLKGIRERRGAFKKKSNIVHLANGVIVFNEDGNADLCEFSPDFYSRNQSPIPYDPHARCEKFLNELIYPAVSTENAILLQKYGGMCLLGDNIIQRLLILDGLAGRGKTQFALVIQKLIGQLNVSELRTKHLSDRFELYRYLKKQLLVGVDVPGNFLSEKGAYVIKGLVGGDYFDAEQKGGTGCFPLQGNFCILITSNSRLQVRLDGDIGAWRRRLLIVRYEAQPPKKKIPNFADVLIKEEGPGILNWCLAGLGMLLDDVSQHGDIQLDPEQTGIVDSLLAESDSLRIFLKENIENHEHCNLSIPEIVEAYAQFCPERRWNPKHITVIYRELEGLMLELFGSSKSNSIVRDGKDVKGFRRVRFTMKEETNAKKGT